MVVKVVCLECREHFLVEDPFESQETECPACGNRERVKTGILSSGNFIYYLEPHMPRDDEEDTT